MAQLMKDTSHPDNKIHRDYYQAKKLVSGLGLTSQKLTVVLMDVCCFNTWWVVIKMKPRGVVDTRYDLQVAYQEEQSHVSASIENDPIDCLRDDQVVGEEVDKSSYQPIVNEDGHDLIDGEDDEAASEEEEEEEAGSEEDDDDEEATSEEEDIFDSDDSQDQFQTQEEDEEEDEDD
ncbi:uncharacterized protein LOC132034781 [Lycium ferocissimum]|uniref:uncharacterized protein LOC132034781 n=1 Tax=Lycium ferocissimum TaxID=112874 RepID=UPI002815E1EA|nr:uncharacterized protein LOC132034781 [Lycium ferocissimum]